MSDQEQIDKINAATQQIQKLTAQVQQVKQQGTSQTPQGGHAVIPGSSGTSASWSRDLWDCPHCLATIHGANIDKHETWHKRLDAVAEMVTKLAMDKIEASDLVDLLMEES